MWQIQKFFPLKSWDFGGIFFTQKITCILPYRICFCEKIHQHEKENHYSTPMFCFFDEIYFHTVVTKRNSSAICTKGILWNNFFAKVAIF
jgi:hypothetical protein